MSYKLYLIIIRYNVDDFASCVRLKDGLFIIYCIVYWFTLFLEFLVGTLIVSVTFYDDIILNKIRGYNKIAPQTICTFFIKVPTSTFIE